MIIALFRTKAPRCFTRVSKASAYLSQSLSLASLCAYNQSFDMFDRVYVLFSPSLSPSAAIVHPAPAPAASAPPGKADT